MMNDRPHSLRRAKGGKVGNLPLESVPCPPLSHTHWYCIDFNAVDSGDSGMNERDALRRKRKKRKTQLQPHTDKDADRSGT